MPQKIDPMLYWGNIAAVAAFVGIIVWRYIRAVQAKPKFQKSDVLFQEWQASGCSQKNLITKIGGGRNCVRLVVTKDFLWVTSWFPFSLLAPIHDMEHVIPLDCITSIKRDSFFGRPTLLVSFTAASGQPRAVRLIPKKPDAFIRSLGKPVAE